MQKQALSVTKCQVCGHDMPFDGFCGHCTEATLKESALAVKSAEKCAVCGHDIGADGFCPKCNEEAQQRSMQNEDQSCPCPEGLTCCRCLTRGEMVGDVFVCTKCPKDPAAEKRAARDEKRWEAKSKLTAAQNLQSTENSKEEPAATTHTKVFKGRTVSKARDFRRPKTDEVQVEKMATDQKNASEESTVDKADSCLLTETIQVETAATTKEMESEESSAGTADSMLIHEMSQVDNAAFAQQNFAEAESTVGKAEGPRRGTLTALGLVAGLRACFTGVAKCGQKLFSKAERLPNLETSTSKVTSRAYAKQLLNQGLSKQQVKLRCLRRHQRQMAVAAHRGFLDLLQEFYVAPSTSEPEPCSSPEQLELRRALLQKLRRKLKIMASRRRTERLFIAARVKMLQKARSRSQKQDADVQQVPTASASQEEEQSGSVGSEQQKGELDDSKSERSAVAALERRLQKARMRGRSATRRAAVRKATKGSILLEETKPADAGEAHPVAPLARRTSQDVQRSILLDGKATGAAASGSPLPVDFPAKDVARTDAVPPVGLVHTEKAVGQAVPDGAAAVSHQRHHGLSGELPRRARASGSEHTVDGSHFDAEMHIMHSLAKPPAKAVVGLLIKGDPDAADNPCFTSVLTEPMPATGCGFALESFDLSCLALQLAGSYYSYSGSLTTPPCTEGVQWFVMATPVTISSAQLVSLKAVLSGLGPTGNNRPTQPLDGRTVFITGH